MADNAAASPSRQPSAPKPKRPPHNLVGKNQYKDRPLLDDPRVAELLNAYHLRGITDNRVISNLLLEEHGVILGERSVYRRKKMLGLWASKHTTKELSEVVKRQLVAAQMAKDPSGRLGARVVKQRVFEDTGLHLTRDYIRAEMRRVDPAAHAARGPAHILSKRQKSPAVSESASTSTSIAPGSANPAAANTTDVPTTATIHTTTQEQRPSSDGVNTDQPSSTRRRVRAPRRPRPARGTEAPFLPAIMPRPSTVASSSSQPQAHLPPEQEPPSGLPSSSTSSTSSTSFLFHPVSQLSFNHNVHASTLSTPLSDMQQYSHPQHRLPMRTTPPRPSTSSFSMQDHLNRDQRDYDNWANDNNSEDDFFSRIGPDLISNDNQRHNASAAAERAITSGSSSIATPSPQPSQALPHSALSHHAPPPPAATTRRNLDSRTSPTAMQDVARVVEECTPKMGELTRFIESLRLEDDEDDLDAETYDVVLRGMETAALLERQLSRVVALARRSRPPVRRDAA